MEAHMNGLRAFALATAAVGLLAFSPLALAVSPSEESCEGTFTKEQGQVQCVTTTSETAGNAPETSNAQRVTTETTTTGQGNIDNKQQQELDCSGPPGQQPAGCPQGDAKDQRPRHSIKRGAAPSGDAT
jgi:hypothetical protein